MKIKELRIGNYLYYRDDIIEVESLYEKYNGESLTHINHEGDAYGGSSIDGINLNNCTPIPLTEELLVKAGLQLYNPNLYELNPYVVISTDFTIYAVNRQGPIWIAEISKLHELQNWFYLLNNGSELNIQL